MVLGTLVIQGMTLAPLIRLLGLRDDGSVEREVRLARAATARAALDAVDGVASDTVALLRRKYQTRLQRAEADDGAEIDGDALELEQAQRRVHTAERRTLGDLRDRGVIGDDAFHRVEEELDLAELNAETMARTS